MSRSFQIKLLRTKFPEFISSLKSSKSTGPNSILTKILNLLQVQISKHLTDIFPNSLKTATANSCKTLKTGCV